jgi:hypothetical protein
LVAPDGPELNSSESPLMGRAVATRRERRACYMLETIVIAPQVKAESPPANNDFVWGARAIGALIGRNESQTHYLLNGGHIKSARKVGGAWVANVDALRREFGA